MEFEGSFRGDPLKTLLGKENHAGVEGRPEHYTQAVEDAMQMNKFVNYVINEIREARGVGNFMAERAERVAQDKSSVLENLGIPEEHRMVFFEGFTRKLQSENMITLQ